MQYTYRGAYLNALSEVIVAGLDPGSVYLWTLPMFHCNGWCFPWAVTAVAATHVTMPAVDPGRVWDLIDAEGVTHYSGAPTVQLMVIGHPRARRLGRPVTALVAAAPPSPTLLARMSALNFRVVHVYGLTETYGPVTVCPEPPGWDQLPAGQRAQYLARQGQAYPTADLVRVVDAAMADVPRDGATMGEVIMRGNNVMSGYFHDEAATAAAFAGSVLPDRLAHYKCPDVIEFGPLPKTSTGKIQKFVLRTRERPSTARGWRRGTLGSGAGIAVMM